MGTTIEMDLRLKVSEKMAEEMYQEDMKANKKLVESWDTLTFDDGWIEFKNQEYYFDNIFDDDELSALIDFLSKIVEPGVITFSNEAGDHWRYVFDGVGGNTYQYGEVIYKEPYDHFIDSYPDIPKDLSRDIKAWWVARRL